MDPNANGAPPAPRASPTTRSTRSESELCQVPGVRAIGCRTRASWPPSSACPARATGNPVLISLLASLSTRMHRVRLWHGRAADNALDVTREEHRRIYEAIMQGDPELARAAATAHIASGERWLRKQVAAGASA